VLITVTATAVALQSTYTAYHAYHCDSISGSDTTATTQRQAVEVQVRT
jgi:hypothetical protein